MIDKVKPIADCAASFPARATRLAGTKGYRLSLGAALIVGLSAVVALADQPQMGWSGMQSVLRQPVIQLAQPMTLRGIETENSKQFEPAVVRAGEPIVFQPDRPVALRVEEPATSKRTQSPEPNLRAVAISVGQRGLTAPHSSELPAELPITQARQAVVPAQAEVASTLSIDEVASSMTISNDEGARTNNTDRTTTVAYDPLIKPMRDISINIAPPVGGMPRVPTDFASAVYANQPAFPADPCPNGPWFGDEAYGPPLNFCYRPLYFEEANFERYGRTKGVLQPLVSAGSFYGSLAVLPYRLAAQRPGFCTYHHHCYRPGAPAPRERRAPQLRLDAATVQAAAVLGLVFLIP